MKRKIVSLLFAIALASAVSTSVMAADEKLNGFYNIGTAESVTIVPYAGETQVTASEKNINDDSAIEQLYIDSDRFEVTFDDAVSEDHYGIVLVKGDEIPTKDTEIYYINQETASSADIEFNVYPILPTETTDMTLYISSSSEDFDLIKIPVSYAVNATEASTSSVKRGDVDGDGTVMVKDVILIRRYITGGYGVTLEGDAKTAADVDDDGTVMVKDAILIRRYITGGYGVEL